MWLKNMFSSGPSGHVAKDEDIPQANGENAPDEIESAVIMYVLDAVLTR